MLTPAEIDALLLSIRVSGAAVALTVPAAVATAWLLARADFTGKVLLEAFVSLPLVLPPVVTGYLLLIAFGRRGPLGQALEAVGISLSFSWAGAALASAVVAFPLAVRAIRLSFESIDPRLETVARTLGASATRRFFTIALPLAMPGIVTGAILAFARSLGEFGATITFVGNIPAKTRTIPLAIYTATQQPDGDATGARLVAVSLLLAFAALAASEVVARRQGRHRP